MLTCLYNHIHAHLISQVLGNCILNINTITPFSYLFLYKLTHHCISSDIFKRLEI